MPTLAALPTALAAFATTQAEVMATWQAGSVDRDGSAAVPGSTATGLTSVPGTKPTAVVTLVAARGLLQDGEAIGSAALRDGSGAAAGDFGERDGGFAGHLVAVLVLVMLGGVWVWLRR